jgi:hypothetical protein
MLKKSILKTVNNLKLFANKTQLSFWKNGDIVTSQEMSSFTQDIYNKLGLITANSTPHYNSVIGMANWNLKFLLTKEGLTTNTFSINVYQWMSCVFYPTVVPYAPNNGNAIQIVVTDSVTNKIMLTPLALNYVYVKLNISPNIPDQTNYQTTGSLINFNTNQGEQPDLCLVAIIDTRTLIGGYPIEDYSTVRYLSNVGIYDSNSIQVLTDKNDHYHSITPANLLDYSNSGIVATYQGNLYYQKGSQIRTYEENYGYIYWIANANINPQTGIPTVASPKNWLQIYYIDNENNIHTNNIYLTKHKDISIGKSVIIAEIPNGNNYVVIYFKLEGINSGRVFGEMTVSPTEYNKSRTVNFTNLPNSIKIINRTFGGVLNTNYLNESAVFPMKAELVGNSAATGVKVSVYGSPQYGSDVSFSFDVLIDTSI